MATRHGQARWEGDLESGKGTLKLLGQEFSYSFPSRFEEGEGTNPEELIAAAHAGCIAMALSHELSENGYKVNGIDAKASVTLGQDGDGFAISKIALELHGDVDEIDADKFQEFAEGAKEGCPVSKALASVKKITLEAHLKS